MSAMTGSDAAGDDRKARRSNDPVDEAGTARATVDPHGIVTGWSEGARRLLGHRSAEVVGRPAARLLAEEPSARALRSLRTPRRWSGAVRLLHRDGHRLTVNLLAHRREPDGEEAGAGEWFLVSSLVPPPAPAQDDALVMWAFARSPSATALYDTGLRLRRANADMERVIGLPEAAMRGLRVSEIVVDPEGHRTEQCMRQALKTGEQQDLRQVLHLVGHDRESVWATTLTPVPDTEGKIRGVLLSAHDITEQHWARQRLALLNDAGVRIGSTLDVTRTAQELADVAVPRFADFVSVDLLPVARRRRRAAPGPPPQAPSSLRRVAHQSVLRGQPGGRRRAGRAGPPTRTAPRRPSAWSPDRPR